MTIFIELVMKSQALIPLMDKSGMRESEFLKKNEQLVKAVYHPIEWTSIAGVIA